MIKYYILLNLFIYKNTIFYLYKIQIFLDKIAEIGSFSKAFGQTSQKSKISSQVPPENKELTQHISIVNPQNLIRFMELRSSMGKFGRIV